MDSFAQGVPRDGIMTIKEAAVQCRKSGLTGWALVEYAQNLVNHNMPYSYTNSFDLPGRAFQKGRGYCWQQSGALNGILRILGFDSRLVYAVRNQFPAAEFEGITVEAHESGHVWCRVAIDGTEKDVCPGHSENRPGKLHFVPVSAIRDWNSLTAFGSYFGSAYVNRKRYRKIMESKR